MNGFSAEQVARANRDYYNLVHAHYLEDEAYAYTDDIVSDVRRILALGAANSETRDSFFDVACGSGFLSSLVADMKLFSRCEGVDVSENQIRDYNERLGPLGATGIVGDLGNMDFGSKHFSMVAGYSALHHFYDYQQVLSRCWDVLDPGGCMYFDFEPNEKFKRKFNRIVRLRRIVARQGQGLDDLEEIAEYHNNFSMGIDKDRLYELLPGSFEIVEEGARFPGTTTGAILRRASSVNKAFSPLFYFLIKKSK